MKKIKVYRILGWIFIILGIVMVIGPVVEEIMMSEGYDFWSILFMVLGTAILNPGFWIGIILHWRADVAENPNKESKWHRLIVPYSILAGVFIGLWCLAIVIGFMYELW